MNFRCPWCNEFITVDGQSEASTMECPGCKEQIKPPNIKPASGLKAAATLFGILAGFVLAAIGFLLSWGTHHFSEDVMVAGRSYGGVSGAFDLSGKDASFWGYTTLVLGLLGSVLTLVSLALLALKRKSWIVMVASVQIFAGLFGVAFLIFMRFEKGVIQEWGSIDHALSHGDYSLGYPLGPGLAIIGFLIAGIASLVAKRIIVPRGKRNPAIHN